MPSSFTAPSTANVDARAVASSPLGCPLLWSSPGVADRGTSGVLGAPVTPAEQDRCQLANLAAVTVKAPATTVTNRQARRIRSSHRDARRVARTGHRKSRLDIILNVGMNEGMRTLADERAEKLVCPRIYDLKAKRSMTFGPTQTSPAKGCQA